MDVVGRQESGQGTSIAETPASLPSQYSGFQGAGLGFDQDSDGIGLQYSHDMDPMIVCMGAPTREGPAPVSNLSPAKEETMLATIKETCNRTRAVQYPGAVEFQSLKEARSLMQQLWEDGSTRFPMAVKELLELNNRGKFSAVLGEAGFVDVFLNVLETGDVLNEIAVPSLQFLGDACEKTETNRARVMSRGAILAILYKLWNPSLVPIAIPAIFQICVNCEPAQQQAADLATARILVDLLQRPEGEGVPRGGGAYPVLQTICRLLDMISTKNTDLYSDATAKELLDLAKKNEENLELYLRLIHTAATWLKLARVRLHFVADGNGELLLQILEDSYTRPNLVTLSTADDKKTLQNLRIAIVEALAAISATPQFCVINKLNGKFVVQLREWLLMSYPQLQACACIVLGNMANSWMSAKEMTQQFRLHDVSLILLEQSDSIQVKAAAAGLLKSLLVSRECRKEVAEKPFMKAVSQLWVMASSPHLQYLGVVVALQAVEGSFPVVKQLLAPLSPDPDSPAHFKSHLNILLNLWRDYHGYRQHEKLLLAIALLVANVCTLLWSPSPLLSSPREMEELKKRVTMQHADLGYPLSWLLGDENPPTVRSKFWFVMALMADDPQATDIISNTIVASEVSNAISGLLSRARQFGCGQGDKGQGQYDDRNVLILISRLVKKTESFKSRQQREILLNLVEGIDLEAMSKENPLEPM